MGNKSQNGHKKKHVNKHVLKAREDKEAVLKMTVGTVSSEGNPSSSPLTPKRKQKKNRHVKDPSEAAAYLQQWKESKKSTSNTKESSSGSWKFNKNTQSWLIRHMYEADIIPKSVFSLLLEYLQGLEGKATTTWLRSDASRRALRYKDYEKKSASESPEGRGSNDDDQNNVDKREEEAEEEKSKKTPDEREEEARWAKLNDHDKRKEYKRARKILETIASP